MFYLSQAAMDHLPSGGSIINTTSVTAYMGHANLLDYASTKGAIVSFTRSLAQQVVDKGIRVNAGGGRAVAACGGSSMVCRMCVVTWVYG